MRPPGPTSLIPGRILRAMQRDPITFLTNTARTFGDVAFFRLGPQPAYLVSHPELIREVLVTQHRSFHKGRALQRAKLFLGEGLLTSEEDFHRRQRRLAQPAFHRDRIRRYGEVMVEYALRTRDEWRDGAVVDMSREMNRLTLAIVGKTLFDADVGAQADDVGSALTDLMELFGALFNPLAPVMRHLPLPSTLRFNRARTRLDKVIYGIIEERRRSGEDRGDLLSMLLLAQDEEGDGGGMSDLQVRDEAMTIFLAGHETTSNALMWTWYLLAQHPDVFEQLTRELDEVLGDRPPSPADYPRLPFTEMVFAESMRLYPPAWLVGRLAIEDVSLGGFTIPKGAVAIVSQMVTHRDERFWPEPLRFDPLRFTADAKASRPKFAYFPFGGGPRVCIGEGFAWMEGVLLLATLAQRFRVELVDHDVVMQPVITLRAKGGIRMRLRARA
jgi:cytochrome P450